MISKDYVIVSNPKFEQILSKIKEDWPDKLHILADFDRTLTKADKRNARSMIAILREKNILWEDYSQKAYQLYQIYYPIEKDPSIPIDEKKEKMKQWWEKHLDLIVETWLYKHDITKALKLWAIQFRNYVKDFLLKLQKCNIPLVILSANWLWTDSIKIYFQENGLFFDNIYIVSNEFIWDQDDKVVWYKKPVIHTCNKDETVLKEFPYIYEKVKNRQNVILFWDSLHDIDMVKWFDYKNLLKIWFLNDDVENLLWEYKKKYDVVILNDWDFDFVNEMMNEIC